MTITTEELRSLRATSNARWAGRGKSARMLVEAFSVDKIAAELITARAKLEAAEKLADAARRVDPHMVGSGPSTCHRSLRDAQEKVREALAAWEAAQ